MSLTIQYGHNKLEINILIFEALHYIIDNHLIYIRDCIFTLVKEITFIVRHKFISILKND